MGISFEHVNAALIAAAVYIALLALVIFLKFSRRTPFLSNFLKLSTVFLLAVSLCGPNLENKKSSANAYVLLDVSESNDEAVMQEELDKLSRFENSDIKLHFLPFSGRAQAGAGSNQSVKSYRDLKLNSASLDTGKTNLEDAFKAALNQEPGSLILLSDGFQSAGNVTSVIPQLKQAGFKIFPFVPDENSVQKKSLKISNLHAPLVAKQGKSVIVKTSIENSTDRQQSGLLEIKHGSKVIFSRDVNIAAGSEAVFEAQSDPSEDGIKEISAVFNPAASGFATSSETIYLSGEKGEKILLLSGTPDDQRFLKRVLEDKSYQLNNFTAGDSDAEIKELKEYSAVIFNNIAMNQVPRRVSSAIETYVESGGSFIMIGGNRSFGLGGYIDTDIAKALPVDLLPPQKEEKRLNVAVQLLIDKSRSMAESNKIDFAKEAAIAVVDNLKDDDFIGVMGFDVNPFVVIRLSRLSQVRSEATRRIGLLYPNKGTSVVASIDEGRRDLMRASAGRKHMMILTDGEITDAPQHYYYEMVKQVRLLGITVSTVMLGGEGNEGMLKEMANLGGGAFYRTSDARSLPKIFIADLKVASGERTLREENQYSVRTGPAGILSTKIDSFPEVKGYVQTKSKTRANLELVAYANSKAEPLLASWTYGKGKSLAFTSDANGRWSESWIPWARFQTFWNDIIDSLRPQTEGENSQVRFDLKTFYENAMLNLDLTVFSEAERAAAEAEIILPDKSSRQITLKSVAPGRYNYAVDNPQAGKYELRAKIGNKSLTPVAFNLSGELLGEIKGQGFNVPLLRNLADSTSGKFNPQAEDLKKLQYTAISKKDISRPLIIMALLLFLFEIIWREVLSYKFFRFPRAVRINN